jgi:hypothetical protein
MKKDQAVKKTKKNRIADKQTTPVELSELRHIGPVWQPFVIAIKRELDSENR